MLKKLFFVGLLAIIVHHIVTLTLILGAFKTVYNHKPGPCKVVPGIVNGSEDIAVLPNGLAFISSGIDIFKLSPDADPRIQYFQGRIFQFDFNKPEEAAKVLPIEGDFDGKTLRPHGIDIWQDKQTGKVRLFAVNHYSTEDTIEVFDFDQERAALVHHRTIQHKFIISVNDLVATGPDSFYYTNDGYYRGVKRTLEGLLLMKWASIGYYDGKEAKIIRENGHLFNGINMSPDGKIVYVNEVFAGTMDILKRESDNSLSLLETVTFNSLCDNIFVDEVGDIWQGCHPIGYKFSLHSQNLSVPAPSQVLHVKFADESRRQYEISEVLSNDGSLISGSSVAAYYKGSMLVGTVVDKMAYCQIIAY
ncbi:serum paraoxonase/arylesterase 1-like isoform X1 [Anneissia japonica]|uniref:serum paraoxonase/arylesterase 1-like isoform X1 n=1 Tax=Anneissia japonica TaxID=1529436 RepID=UPI001425BA12|nr:serum paraoxonase/arylesterase 1-like isoform X1 [Anneissia japonica]